MRKSTKGLLLLCAAFLLISGCSPERIDPQDQNERPAFSGSEDPHPALDTTCQISDTLFLQSMDGSLLVNRCFGRAFPGGPLVQVPCTGPSLLWGYVIMQEGYLNDTNYVDADFTLAPGWYADFDNWNFSISGSFTFDNNGFPIVTNDWGSQLINPVQNKWHLRLRVPDLPSPCFQVGIRVNALKLNLFGQPIAITNTTLWSYNRNWNDPNHNSASESPYLLSFCPLRCLDTIPMPIMDTTAFCKVIYKTTNTTCTGNNINCTTLTATTNRTGVLTYDWSNGQHTPSITVCTNRDYTYYCLIRENGEPVEVNRFDVHVANISCTAETPIVQLAFCTTNLNLRYGNTFNIRNYIRFYNGGVITGNQWNQVRFTYTELGANLPTVPPNWNLAAFNAGTNVTVGIADYASGTGNVGRGQYRVFAYRLGRSTYDASFTIRVNNTQVSTVNSAMCSNIVGGPVCTVPSSSNGGEPTPGIRICWYPPGNPGAAQTGCAPASSINDYVRNTCPGTSNANPANRLGPCEFNPCL